MGRDIHGDTARPLNCAATGSEPLSAAPRHRPGAQPARSTRRRKVLENGNLMPFTEIQVDSEDSQSRAELERIAESLLGPSTCLPVSESEAPSPRRLDLNAAEPEPAARRAIALALGRPGESLCGPLPQRCHHDHDDHDQRHGHGASDSNCQVGRARARARRPIGPLAGTGTEVEASKLLRLL